MKSVIHAVIASVAWSGLAVAQAPLGLSFTQMVVDPTNSNTFWGATAKSLYRSTDRGNIWRPVAMTPGALSQKAVSGIYVHPHSGQTVYVTTSDSTGAGDLWKTVDGGATWTSTGPSGAKGFSGFFFNRNTPATVYAQDVLTLYKSTDGAQTWKRHATLPGEASGINLDINPNDPNRMYCTIYGFPRRTAGLFVSRDEGLTWTPASFPPLPPGNQPVNGFGGLEVHSNPQNPDVITFGAFVCYQISEGCGEATYFFYSADAGGHFQYIPNVPPSANGAIFPYYVSWNGEVSLANDFLFGEYFLSKDFGLSWKHVTASTQPPYAFDPENASVVYDAGAHSGSTDGGLTWKPLNPRYYPILAPLGPINVTLESDTSYISGGSQFFDIEGSGVSFSNPNVTFTGAASWLKPTLRDDGSFGVYFFYRASARGLSPGNYDGEMQISSPDLAAALTVPVHLTVVQHTQPKLLFGVKRIAGTGADAFSGDNGPATQAAIACCSASLILDAQRNLYLSSPTRIRRIAPNGIITTFAGTGTAGDGGDGGPATAATFTNLAGMALSSDGLVVVDGGKRRLRVIRSDGKIANLYAGNAGGGPQIDSFTRLAADSGGRLFTSDFPGVVFEWNPTGTWTQVFQLPHLNYFGITPSNEFVANTGSQLSLVDAQFKSTPVAGTGVAGFSGDHGAATQARIAPEGAPVIDKQGNIFFVDTARIRVVMPSGVIETVAGDGDLENPLADGALATSGSLNYPTALSVDAAGSLYVATFGNFIYQLLPTAAPVPAISPGGVVSLATGTPRVSPGAIFAIYGSKLADAVASAPSIPLPNRLGGVQVSVNGRAAPLFYVSPTQVNAQVPWETATGTASVIVTRNGVASGPVTVNVVSAAPDILIYGSNRAVAILPNGSLNGPSHAAAAGTYLVVYFTGVGAVDLSVATGAASPSNPPAKARGKVEGTIGGKSATVAFLGLAPTFVGLGQANIQVPGGLAAGDHPLVISIDGNTSNSAVVSLK